VPFSLGIYYMALPESAGGDLDRADTLFRQAIETGPDWLLNRWGRAKYFYDKTGNRDGFVKDLEWVLARDVSNVPGPPAWNAYIRRDAGRLLEEIERYF
jgi:hypothetical protein